MENEEQVFAVLYTESHRDKMTTFLGVYTTEAKAEEAIERHMTDEKARLPRASIHRSNYQVFDSTLDQPYF